MITRPGRGWTHVGNGCWDHVSGIRIHVHGLLRLPSGEFVWGTQWPESQSLHRAICLCGGNRKRGVMTWALEKTKEMKK